MLPDYTPVEGDYPPGNPNMPFGYLAGLIGWVGKMQNDWKVLSYKDLNISPNQNDKELLNEFKIWHAKHLLSRKKYLLFQYDVDARQDATEALLRVHLEAGVPANVMIFNQRIWDRDFKQTGKIKVDESYKLDFGLLREFSQAGGVVGYHCNVWERSLFDLQKAKELFTQDVDSLRSEIDMDFFSMHGGPTDEKGRSNAHIVELKDFAADMGLTWVHNGRSPSFHRMWDDGGAGHKNYRYRMADASEALSSLKNGNRCRLLFHPQYYRCSDAKQVKNENQKGMAWFEDMLEQYKNGKREYNQKPTFLQKILRKKPIQTEVVSRSDWFAQEYWPARLESLENKEPLIKACVDDAEKDEGPVFVNGMSRSGTTLMNALLDVHPDIAMSYELYPNYLTGHGDVIEKPIDFSAMAYILRNLPKDEAYRLLQQHEKGDYADFVRYMACAGHSDLSPRDIGDLLKEYLKIYNTIHTYEDSLRFLGVCARLKMKRLNKNLWGAKSQGKFEKYTSVWQKAKFIYMMRDGRDILASQMNTGSFNPETEKVAKAWVDRIKRFKNLMQRNEINGIVVKYEELAFNTEKTLRQTCDEIGIPFHGNMLNHSKHDISLLHEPRGQLSAAQVAKPIDTSAIGRWKKDLDETQIKIFQDVAGKELEEWKYEIV